MSLHRQSKGKVGEPLREEAPGSSEEEMDPTKMGVGEARLLELNGDLMLM